MALATGIETSLGLYHRRLVGFPVHKFRTQGINGASLVSGTALAAGIAAQIAVLTPAASAMPLTFPRNAKLWEVH